MHPALRLLAADDGAVVVDDVGVDGVVVAEGDDGRDELGWSSGADRMCFDLDGPLEQTDSLEFENSDGRKTDVLTSWTVL